VNALRTILLLCFIELNLWLNAIHAEEPTDSLILLRVMTYKQSVAGSLNDVHTNIYTRYYFKTARRNFTLMVIPSMYAISKGHREFAGETFSNIYIRRNTIAEATRLVSVGTIPHHRNAMTTLLKYLMPNIYDVTLIDNQILSPFNAYNARLYRYEITPLTESRVEIVFRPKRYNTQLISGSAITDKETGRIISIKFNGEYDMVKFHADAEMGDSGISSLMPKTCDINAQFHFIGNKIEASYHSVYDIPNTLPDSIKNSHDTKLMEAVRPSPLPYNIQKSYDEYIVVKQQEEADVIKKKENSWSKALLDLVGDYVINRTKGNFGTKNQGAFRISPILNPLYLSYSKRKGVIYKLKVNGSYVFTENQDISLMFKAGYSFKQHQLYFRMPLKYNFDKKRNGYVALEIGNGNRITNSTIVDQIKHENIDSIKWDKMNLDYFKDFYLKATANYDLSRRWSVQPGLTFHKRSAVDKRGFEIANRPVKYYSFAPTMQVQYRPYGWRGPIITADYERGIKMGKANMKYERIEFDVSWKKDFHSLRSLSMRYGSGFYTSKSHNSYFLDYVNFREENIPGGWNDDWTGEYQLLNSNWYNVSEYYVRTNITYESPLMLLSRIPYIGRLMEMERIYVNTLFVEHLHPYVECGYGFTNRFFSMGIFTAISNRRYDGFGCRFAFELFRDW